MTWRWRDYDWRRARRILLRTLVGAVSVPLIYLLIALILGLVPANFAWREAQAGVTIYVRTNGVHTWIMMPKVNDQFDWRPYAPSKDLRDPRYGAGDHVAIGYGNRQFYLNTPTWADLTLRNAFFAFFGGGRTLLHVEHEHQPRPNAYQRPIILTPAQYVLLTNYISRRFQLDADRRPIPLIGRGYNDWDMFYEANGGYSFVLTCNEWTGRALRAAGVRTGIWTPLEQSIMWRLD